MRLVTFRVDGGSRLGVVRDDDEVVELSEPADMLSLIDAGDGGLAAAIALPLGMALAGGGRWFRPIVLGLASLGQIVPSIAVLALAFTLIGLGFRPEHVKTPDLYRMNRSSPAGGLF